jgi:cytochrome c-type biogenesis protein CcmF
MAVGIIGIEMFQTQTQGSLAQGEAMDLGRYTIVNQGVKIFTYDDEREVARAELDVFKDGEYLMQINPRLDYYFDPAGTMIQQMTIPGVRSTLEDDFYVIMVAWEPVSTQNATFRVFHNPLVNWLWIGGIVFILGTMVAAWPDKDPEYATVRTRRTQAARA